MANKNANFANREVADLMLVDYSTKKLFLNVDWANVTSTSFEGDRVFATGGQGAPNRVQFDGSRTGTLTIEAQVYPQGLPDAVWQRPGHYRKLPEAREGHCC